MAEEWKDIKGFPLYKISNLGRVMSCKFNKEKIISYRILPSGYCQVPLSHNGKVSYRYVHRLVAEAFLSNEFNLPEVNHLDENKSNNNLDNLEWISVKGNRNYGTRVARMSKQVKALNSKGDTIYNFKSIAEAHREGFNQGGVVSCCKGRIPRYKGLIWKYI